MTTITNAIKNEIRLFKRRGYKSAFEINNGACEEFAQKIESKVTGAREVATQNYSDIDGIITIKGKRVSLPGHCWITYKGKYYDAETPEGVTNYLDLKIFKKVIGRHK